MTVGIAGLVDIAGRRNHIVHERNDGDLSSLVETE